MASHNNATGIGIQITDYDESGVEIAMVVASAYRGCVTLRIQVYEPISPDDRDEVLERLKIILNAAPREYVTTHGQFTFARPHVIDLGTHKLDAVQALLADYSLAAISAHGG